MLFMTPSPRHFEYFFVWKNLYWKARKRLASSLPSLCVTFMCVVLFLMGKDNYKHGINFCFFSPVEEGGHWCIAGKKNLSLEVNSCLSSSTNSR